MRDDEALLKVLRRYGDVVLVPQVGWDGKQTGRQNYYIEVLALEEPLVVIARKAGSSFLDIPAEAKRVEIASIGVGVRHGYDPRDRKGLDIQGFKTEGKDILAKLVWPEVILKYVIEKNLEIFPDVRTWKQAIRAVEKVRVEIREALRQGLTPNAVLELLQFAAGLPREEELLDKPLKYIWEGHDGTLDRVTLYTHVAKMIRDLKRGVIKHPNEYFRVLIEGTTDGQPAKPRAAIEGMTLQYPFDRGLEELIGKMSSKTTPAFDAAMRKVFRLVTDAQAVITERVATLRTMLLRAKDDLWEELYEDYSGYFGRSTRKPFWFPKKEEGE